MDRGLWTECAACSTRSAYSGRAEWNGDQLHGLFHCPQCRVDFPVWRPGFEALLADDASDPAGELLDLAERLCRVTTGAADEMRAAIGAPDSTAPLDAENVDVTPGPSSRATVDLRAPRRSPTFDRLDATFGPGAALPRTGAEASHQVAWTVRAPGAPSTVSVFARFRHAPQSYSRPFGILLRIDPGAFPP